MDAPKQKHYPCGYMNETDFIKNLQKLIDNVDLNETSIKKKVEAEVVIYKNSTDLYWGRARIRQSLT